MDYSRESQDRMQKIQALKNAGVIVYANHFHGKQDISYIETKKDGVKDVEKLMA